MFGAFAVHPGHAAGRAAAALLSEVALLAVVSAAPAQESTRSRWESLANGTRYIAADRVDLAIAPDRLASGEQPRLWRVRAVVRARSARRITIRYCA